MSDEGVNPRRYIGDVVPVPDPTRLTTDQLDRAVDNILQLVDAKRQVLEEKLNALQAQFVEREARIDAISDHIAKAHEVALQDVRDAIVARATVQRHEEKFNAIQIQFSEQKETLDRSLASAKEAAERRYTSDNLATAKSEAAFTKQIDQLGYLTQQTTKATDDKIDDLKARIQALEGIRKGGDQVFGWIIGAGGVIVAIITVAVAIMRDGHTP